MHSINVMHDYYAGQKLVGIGGGSVAVILVLIGIVAFRQTAHPAHAFGLTTLIIAGGFILPANVAYFFYVGPQTTRIESVLKRNPTEFRVSEEKHLDKMFRGFTRSYTIDGLAIAFGLFLTLMGHIRQNPRQLGIGLAVALCASALLAGEVWSKQRAMHYCDALHAVRIGD